MVVEIASVHVEDGVRHTVWRVKDPNAYVRAFAKLSSAYVADGHHRSASAARAGLERRQQNLAHTGDEEYNWFLAALFPVHAILFLADPVTVAGLRASSRATRCSTLAKGAVKSRQC